MPTDLLAKLDEQQRQAALSLIGPTCIIAGAGTGKTRTITHRIAYGIAKGYYSANGVLALTYTNKAAAELRSRLRALGVGTVSAKTFHSAALAQLEFFWPQFAGAAAPAILESKAKVLGKLAEERKLRLDVSAIRDLAAEIEWRKFSMLSIAQYAATNRKPPAGISTPLMLELLSAYEDAKVAANQIDWEDVLILCLGMLRAEPRALAHVQQQYRFFTVDEYQDISPLQQALLDTWLGDRSDLCVVGDPNQTIYSFTGASSRFLHDFQSRYEAANVIELTQNYRSTRQIVTFANRLRTGNQASLTAAGPVGLAPRIMNFDSATDEAAYLAHQVSTAIASGTKPSQIAILYRINGQSEALERALANAGVEYQLRGGVRFFARPEITQAMQTIRAELASGAAATARDSAAGVGKTTGHLVTEIARGLGWNVEPPASGGAARDKWESLNALLGILDEVPADISLEDFYNELVERQRSQHDPVRAAVTLSTIHAAKGLEWDYVYVAGVAEGYLPISYAKTEAEIAEELRLLYVAITRARRHLLLSWSAADHQSGSQQRPRQASRFLQLLQPKH